ncbi:cytochrome P450 [Daedalea quercina L-15889]|uniref:Cytochrome P450 n=1 Tax=Daedalea quercina L-15889 TaxID=1314783 RepID=A0A165RJK5_9APHY|nr:cytochrome P450 [Daedalea quercina L-15889]
MLPTVLASVASGGLVATATVIVLALCYISCASVWRRCKYLPSHPPPPGPQPLPLLGNAHQVPRDYPYRTFSKWAERFGDPVLVKVFHKPVIVLNSLRNAKELLEVRGAKYSDRPPLYLMKIIGFDVTTPFLCYGEQWRRHRKWIQAGYVDQAAVARLRPFQRRGTTMLLARLVQYPEDFDDHVKRFVTTLIMDSTYGRLSNEALITSSMSLLERFIETGTPAASLVDYFPFLQYIPPWIPGSVLNTDTWKIPQRLNSLMDDLFQNAKSAMISGTGNDSFVSCMLEQHLSGQNGADEEAQMKAAAITVYLGGSRRGSSTGIPLKTFILAMIIHEEVYAKAQREIDEVVGSTRLPELNDRDSLPYVDAILKEVYRINTPLPISIPRRVVEDDEFLGFQIPKGTSVVANLWSVVHRDPECYADPDEFNPGRFIDPASGKSAGVDPRDYIFSFGRRECPGRRFADDSLWLAVSNIIAAFNIEKAVDAEGREVTPSLTFLPGPSRRVHPENFTCSIRPRSQRALELITEMSSNL